MERRLFITFGLFMAAIMAAITIQSSVEHSYGAAILCAAIGALNTFLAANAIMREIERKRTPSAFIGEHPWPDHEEQS